MVGQAPPSAYCQCLYPQGEVQLPPPSLGGSPRSAAASDPGCFQIIASALGPGACEILYAPLRVESTSHGPLTLPKLSPASSQGQWLWGLIFLVQTPGLRSLMQGSELSLLWENLYTVVIHHFVGCPPGFWDFIKDLPFLPVSVWFLLYVFNCRRSLLVGSGLFHRWLFCK